MPAFYQQRRRFVPAELGEFGDQRGQATKRLDVAGQGLLLGDEVVEPPGERLEFRAQLLQFCSQLLEIRIRFAFVDSFLCRDHSEHGIESSSQVSELLALFQLLVVGRQWRQLNGRGRRHVE